LALTIETTKFVSLFMWLSFLLLVILRLTVMVFQEVLWILFFVLVFFVSIWKSLLEVFFWGGSISFDRRVYGCYPCPKKTQKTGYNCLWLEYDYFFSIYFRVSHLSFLEKVTLVRISLSILSFFTSSILLGTIKCLLAFFFS